MPISFETIRVGKKYKLNNDGEEYVFEVMEKLSNGDFKLKDIHTFENYNLSTLVQFGKTKDYDLQEK
jgi:hypothetical protein